MKEANITRFSIVLVIIIFIIQVVLVFLLHQSNLNLLQREINLSAEEAYQFDLNRRMSLRNDSTTDTKERVKVKFIGDELPPELDTSQVKKITRLKSPPLEKDNLIRGLNLSMEEFLSTRKPIELSKFDSIASKALEKVGIELPFYSEIVDLENNKIIDISNPSLSHSSDVLISKDIPLNVAQTKVLRLVLIDPMSRIYLEMFAMLILSVIICIVCIYSFHYHRKTLAKQRKIVQLKNDVFSDISHEFKRPLSTLMQILSSFENEKVITNPERRNRYLKLAAEEIQKMTGQTEMILSIAMDDEGVLQMNRTEYSIEEQISEIADRFTETSAKPIDIEVVSEMENPLISADKYHVEHMLTNLLSNAVKYSKPPLEIIITLIKDNNWLYISVKDNGIGISEEDQINIFDRYSRVGDTTLARGHGIGLNYVKRMVEKHEGEISVKSELDKGSEFIIKLPLSKKYRN